MQFNISGRAAPYTFAATGVGIVMRDVMLGLLPGTLLYAGFFGWGVISNVLLAIGFAIAFEGLALHLRKRPVIGGLSDLSAIVTAWLFALALPPMSAWWLIALGIGFAILVAKHVYGGLGYNPFNPAMVGYVVLLISFPREMTLWLPAQTLIGPSATLSLDLAQTLGVVFGGTLPEALSWDALTQATALDTVKTGLGQGQRVEEILRAPLFGYIAGRGWEWIGLAWLVGGIWLLYRRVISWHIPVGVLLSLAAFASLFYLIDSDRYTSPVFHLFSGAALLGAFFIATDPVTAASSNAGRFVYAVGIGALTYIIRTWGGYPDGIAFAVLLANMCAPTIDYYFRPRAFGHTS